MRMFMWVWNQGRVLPDSRGHLPGSGRAAKRRLRPGDRPRVLDVTRLPRAARWWRDEVESGLAADLACFLPGGP
jgi:hypothetical protein